MAVAKIYNSQTGQWEAVIVGETGATGATGPQGPAGNDGALSPNYIINGAFDIFQRGRGPFTNPAFFTDRFLGVGVGETYVVETKELTPGDIEAIGFGDIKNYLEVDLQVNNGSARFETRLEDARTLSGQEVTLSFWARSDVNGLELQPNLRQEFIDSPQVSALGQIFLSTTWERYEIQYTLPSVTGKTINDASYLRVEFRFAGTDTARLDITGVQLEAGSVATPFKRNANSIQGELAACQRYYEDGSVVWVGRLGNGITQYGMFRSFLTEKRTTPTITLAGQGENNFENNDGSAPDVFADGVLIKRLSSATDADAYFITNYTADAEL